MGRGIYLASEQRSVERVAAMRAAYASLDGLYASSKSRSEKLAEKSATVQSLRARLGFKREINNATLIQYKTYNSGQEELAALLRACGDDWPKMIVALKTLETATFARPQESDIGSMIPSRCD